MAARKLTAVFEPDGTGWLVTIPEVEGCVSHGRSLAEARRRIREALAVCGDVLPGAARLSKTVELAEDVRIQPAARKALRKARSAREREARAVREREVTTVATARALRKLGLSLRDAGELLGLSHQRVKQIAG